MRARIIQKINLFFCHSRKELNTLGKDWLFLYSFLSLLSKNFFCTYLIFLSQNITSGFKNIFIFHTGSFFNYCGYALILLFIAFFFRNKARSIALIILNLLFSVFLLSLLWYARAYGDVPSVQQLGQIIRMGINPANGPGNLFIVIRFTDILFIFDIPFLFLVFLYKKCTYVTPKSFFASSFVFLISISLVLFVAPATGIAINELIFKQPNSFRDSFEKSTAILSPPGYSFYKSYSQWKENQYTELSTDERKKIIKWFEDKKESLPDNKYKSVFKGKNLVIIQVESLERFVLDKKINGQEITPNLNKLSANGLFFSNIYEQIGGGGSCDADLMTNASVYPFSEGSTFYSHPFIKYNSLPKLLGEKGYETFALYPFEGSLWNWSLAMSSMGFKYTFDSSIYDMTEKFDSGISDRSYLRQVEPIIKSQKQPFFFFLWTNTTHSPFTLPSQYKELALDKNLDNSILGNYFQVIHYTDKQLGSFIDNLENDGLLSETVIIIYGDHEGVHKYYQKEISEIKPAEEWWQNNNKQIPLIIYQSKTEGEEISTVGGQIDFMPTIAYLMGIEEDEYIKTALGRNLLKTNKNYAVLRNKEFIGSNSNEDEKKFAIEGFDISDILIKTESFEDISR